MRIIQNRRNFMLFSTILVVSSLVLLLNWGLRFGLDFKGGVLLEVKFSEQSPGSGEISSALEEFKLGSLTIQSTEKDRAIIRYFSDDDAVNERVQKKIKGSFPDSSIERVEFINSTVSGELKRKAVWANILGVIGIALYIAWAFRKVSYPVTSWKYGLAAVVALAHDIIITLGIFAILGQKMGVEVGIPFVAALLTILGYSVNDTIVVFDRIRENLNRAGAKDDFEETVNRSINETIARSINTSLTVIIVLLAIIFFGGASLQSFTLALLFGVFFGTYSSIFIASALLVEFWKWGRNKQGHKKHQTEKSFQS